MTAAVGSSTRLPRKTLASEVTERIRASLLNGDVAPGTQLSEVEVANGYGVSRGPVREALQRLVQEGLLVSEAHIGVHVPVMTEADFRDIYVARDALESSAVRTILTRGRGGETARELLRHVELMETAQADGDWGRLGRHDLDFHVALVAASQSPRLTRMFDTVISETKLCLGVLTSVPARIDLVPEHRLIADELEAGGEEQVLRTLRKHYDDAVLTLIDPQQGSGPVGIQGGARDV